MTTASKGVFASWEDVWLLGGVRTPFVDYNGALGGVSPIDMGIKVAREAFIRSGVPAADVGTVIAGNMAQACFDSFMLPRHIGLYSGVPVEVPAHLVQRVCGSGIEALSQSADAVALGRADVALCVGTESMSRNPISAYTHRSGFRMGAAVEFRDFLWESLRDTAPDITMGDTAENLARTYGITRQEVDAFAARSFEKALAAQAEGFFDGEIAALEDEAFELPGYATRRLKLRGEKRIAADTHVRPSPVEALAKIRPAFGGVQTGGNSSGVVDGAAAGLVVSGTYAWGRDKWPLARLVGAVSIGVPPEIMGIGPAPAITALLDRVGLPLSAIDRFEINEAFGAQAIAVCRELKLDTERLNVNGGATAIGHPLGATGVRLAITISRELRRSGGRYGIASACIGGGQGIALLVENPEAAN